MRALVLCGDGINCEQETAAAAEMAGFRPLLVHVNDLLESQARELADTKLLIIPGGFSFGDELGSGKILALKLKYGLRDALDQYISARGAVLGICNGFQVLVRFGIFGNRTALTQNVQGHFIDRWVGLEISGHSIFTDRLKSRGVNRLELPIRHGEGRLVFREPLKNIDAVLRYESDVNGSVDAIAALSAHEGRVMGLMPHPEAFWTEELHPWGAGRGVPLGVELFQSAYDVLKGSA